MCKRIEVVLALVAVLGVAAVAQADVVAGNLITNGDFNTDVSGWTAYSVSGTPPVWTNTVADGGGALYSGNQGILYQTTSSGVGASSDPLTLMFDAGSPDASVAGGSFMARLWDLTTNAWVSSDRTDGAIWYDDLNKGVKSYVITFPTITVGHAYELDVETYGVGSGATITCDNIALYRTPEPSTLVLVVSSLVSLLAYAWRKRR